MSEKTYNAKVIIGKISGNVVDEKPTIREITPANGEPFKIHTFSIKYKENTNDTSYKFVNVSISDTIAQKLNFNIEKNDFLLVEGKYSKTIKNDKEYENLKANTIKLLKKFEKTLSEETKEQKQKTPQFEI